MAPKLFHTPGYREDAKRFDEWCDLVEVASFPAEWGVCLSEAGLGLSSPDYPRPYYPAFKRDAHHSELVKACGTGATALDAFAGFGNDGLALAQAGFDVTCVERERLVWLLLQEACDGFGNAHALCAEAQTVMDDGVWDVIYLDPMFPERNKRALPNRGLQHLRALARPQTIDLDETLALAQARARSRVVLKRRLRDPVTGKPNFQIRGRTIRFDVYVGLVSDTTA